MPIYSLVLILLSEIKELRKKVGYIYKTLLLRGFLCLDRYNELYLTTMREKRCAKFG